MGMDRARHSDLTRWLPRPLLDEYLRSGLTAPPVIEPAVLPLKRSLFKEIPSALKINESDMQALLSGSLLPSSTAINESLLFNDATFVYHQD